jgi:hypothetical protein
VSGDGEIVVSLQSLLVSEEALLAYGRWLMAMPEGFASKNCRKVG